MPQDWQLTDGRQWQMAQTVRPESYRCGCCGSDVASAQGWQTDGGTACIRICPMCNVPTFFSVKGLQIPGPKSGAKLTKLPPAVLALYEEARQSRSANAFTGSVMLCRKLLMHTAVEKGADEDQKFAFYVKWLIENHYAPTGSDGWLGYVKTRANEANHDIAPMTKEDADALLLLTEQLLRNVYELPNSVPPLPASKSGTSSSVP